MTQIKKQLTTKKTQGKPKLVPRFAAGTSNNYNIIVHNIIIINIIYMIKSNKRFDWSVDSAQYRK